MHKLLFTCIINSQETTITKCYLSFPPYFGNISSHKIVELKIEKITCWLFFYAFIFLVANMSSKVDKNYIDLFICCHSKLSFIAKTWVSDNTNISTPKNIDELWPFVCFFPKKKFWQNWNRYQK